MRRGKFSVHPGEAYGRLTTIELVDYRRQSGYRWLCSCTCGNTATVFASNLRRGHTKSCGCLFAEQVKKPRPSITRHGQHGTPEYGIWANLKARCLNPNDAGFERYGGRGITVSDRWLGSFENFISDMGPRPSPGHSIDRIDVNGPYSPENCRWATTREQSRNRRSSAWIEAFGERLILTDWCARYGLDHSTVQHRLRRGWTPEAAVSSPPLGKAEIARLANEVKRRKRLGERENDRLRCELDELRTQLSEMANR